MIREITIAGNATGDALTIPKQPRPYRVLAVCFTITAVAGATVTPIFTIGFGSVAGVVAIPGLNVANGTSGQQTFAVHSADVAATVAAGGLVVASTPIPPLTITSQMQPSITLDSAAAGDIVSESCWLIQDIDEP